MLISKNNVVHYVWGENCDGWHLLKTDSLSVIQERMPPGTAETLHFHTKAKQLFFILSGVATMELEGNEYMVNAGESFYIKCGKKHRIKNTTDEDLHFLVISEPKSHGDRIDC